MIYLQLNKSYEVILINPNIESLSSEELSQGFIFQGIVPEEERFVGKRSVMKYNPDTNKIYYEYVDQMLTPEEKIQQLEQELAVSKEDNVSNMLAITELYELILGGGA